jgi:hypothetical protein
MFVADVGRGRFLVRTADVDNMLGHSTMNALASHDGKSHQPTASVPASPAVRYPAGP